MEWNLTQLINAVVPPRKQEPTLQDLRIQRKFWAEAIQQAEAEHKKVHPALWQTECQARANIDSVKQKAAEMIKAAQAEYQGAQRARQKIDEKRDAVAGPCRINLQATQSPKIREFAERLEKRRRTTTSDREWGRDATGREVCIASTWLSVKAAADRIGQILCHELRKVELEALTDDELDARLQDLEDSIPAPKMERLV